VRKISLEEYKRMLVLRIKETEEGVVNNLKLNNSDILIPVIKAYTNKIIEIIKD